MKDKYIKQKYNEVGSLLGDAVNKARSVELIGEEENSELESINLMLNKINNDFRNEISRLESSSEWDKFCIAFFGETNAGKSTIIETLRIIYDEEQRRLDCENQEREYVSALKMHCEEYEDLLNTLQEINNFIIDKKHPGKFSAAMKKLGLVILGIFIGFVILFLGV